MPVFRTVITAVLQASLLVELQGLRAVNAELLKYNKTKVNVLIMK